MNTTARPPSNAGFGVAEQLTVAGAQTTEGSVLDPLPPDSNDAPPAPPVAPAPGAPPAPAETSNHPEDDDVEEDEESADEDEVEDDDDVEGDDGMEQLASQLVAQASHAVQFARALKATRPGVWPVAHPT